MPKTKCSENGVILAPIAVDLDGTIVLSDTLDEAIGIAVFRHPLLLLQLLGRLFQGGYAVKEFLADHIDLANHALPIREDLIRWLTEKASEGHEIHICAATHQRFVDHIAARLTMVSSVVGSTTADLNGSAKVRYLMNRFPQGFIYVGDDVADLPVWEALQGIVLAGANPGVARRAKALGKPVLAEFASPSLTFRDVVRALRMHHWAKNLLLFVPLILAHEWNDLHLVALTLGAFACLLAVTSGTYLLNDISDISSDRQHRSKRHRAMASGRLPLRRGMALAVALILTGFFFACLISLPFATTLAAYLALTLSYSFRLKSTPLLDTLVIGILFTLRLVMGAVLLEVPNPAWLLTFSVFFFFSLAMAKRQTEVVRAGSENGDALKRRGYESGDAPLIFALGTGAAVASLVVLFIFILLEMLPGNAYRHPAFLAGIPALLAIWLGRIWLLAHRGQMEDDPVSFAVRDRVSLVLGGLVAALFAAAL